MLINSMGGILSQDIHISNHHIKHFKYTLYNFVNNTSVKLEKVKLVLKNEGKIFK